MANWEAPLPTAGRSVGDVGHIEDHEAIAAALIELRDVVDEAGKTATWGKVANRPGEYPPAPHEHPVVADEASGLEAAETVQDALQALSARVKALEDAILDA